MSNVAQAIDWIQVKAMLRVAARIDWRGSSNPFQPGVQSKKFPPLLALIGINLFFSLLIGMIVSVVGDTFSALVLGALIAMFLVGMQVFIEFGNIVISPDDFNVISPHPVNSRTFYVAKMLHLLGYVTLLTVSTTMLPSIFIGVSKGWWLIFVLGPLMWVTNVFASFFVMNFYTFVMRFAGRQRLERILGYFQFLFMFIFYSGYIAVSREIRTFLAGADITAWPIAKLAPSYWYASWYQLASDGWDPAVFGFCLLGVAALAVVYRLGVSYMSLGYSESLSESSLDSGKKDKEATIAKRNPGPISRIWRLVASPEERAVGLLTWSHFKHDTKFRLSIFSFVPLVVLYLVLGWKDGKQILDPFLFNMNTEQEGNFLLVMAFALMPLIFYGSMSISTNFKAAWIYHATDCDRMRVVLATRKIAMFAFIIPASIVITGIYAYAFGNILHAVMHVGLLVLFVLPVLTVTQAIEPVLPFSIERSNAAKGSKTFMQMIIALVPVVPFAVVSIVGYGSYYVYFGLLAVAMALNVVLNRMLYKRIQTRVGMWEFLH